MAERSAPGLLAAVQFLTRVPVRTTRPPDLAGAVIWFPVVGALVGAAVGGVAAGLGELVPAGVAAAVAVLFGVLVTGAFHEDGLADTADAVAGGWTVERRLEILDDPRHGTYGVAALCGSIVLRVVAVASLAPAAAFAGLVAAHALGRGAAVVVMGVVPAAGPDGLGADYARAVGTGGRCRPVSSPSSSPPRRPAGGRSRWPRPPRSPPSSSPWSPYAPSAASPATSSAPSSRSPSAPSSSSSPASPCATTSGGPAG